MKKKIILTLAFAAVMLLAGQLSAQLSLTAGYSGKTMNWKGEYTLHNKVNAVDTMMNLGPGYYVGLTYNYKLDEHLGLMSGFMFNHNWQHAAYDYPLALGANLNQDISDTVMDLSIPIAVSYTYGFLDNKIEVYAFAGPTLQLGLQANEVQVDTYSGYPDILASKNRTEVFKRNLYAKNEEGQSFFSRFDLQLSFGLGVRVYGVTLQASYSLGLLDRCGYTDKPENWNTFNMNQFYVGLGYSYSFDQPDQDKDKNKKGKGRSAGRRR